MITLNDVKQNKEISTLITQANMALEALGYTDHGPRHVGYVSKVAADILAQLGYDERTVELAAITGWVHDVGNLISRKHHGLLGASLLFPILMNMGFPVEEACTIIGAVGHHEEDSGGAVGVVSSALIIADKVDAHRTRVRRGSFNKNDVHDRVNYSISKTKLSVDPEKKDICFSCSMDPTSSVMEYMSIYLSRMIMCEKASGFLDCTFSLVVNGMPINNYAHQSFPAQG